MTTVWVVTVVQKQPDEHGSTLGDVQTFSSRDAAKSYAKTAQLRSPHTFAVIGVTETFMDSTQGAGA